MASMSLSQLGNIADLNCDEFVDLIDYAILMEKWLSTEALLPEDLDRNGIVDIADVGILSQNMSPDQGDAVLEVELAIDNPWIYQNLPTTTNSTLTVTASVQEEFSDDTYQYHWTLTLPDDVTITPVTIGGGEPQDSHWTFAAPPCDQPQAISAIENGYKVSLTITSQTNGYQATNDTHFTIALLGDVNKDSIVNVIDCSIINAFWRTGKAGLYSTRDCDVNCDGLIDVADRAVTDAVRKGALGQSTIE